MVTHIMVLGHVGVMYLDSSILTVVTRTVGWQVYVMVTHVHVLPVELCGPSVVGGNSAGKRVMGVCNVMLVLSANVVKMLAVMLLQVGVFVTRGTKTSQIVVQGDADLVSTVKMDSVDVGRDAVDVHSDKCADRFREVFFVVADSIIGLLMDSVSHVSLI